MQIPCVIDLKEVNTENDPRTIKERVINAIDYENQEAVEEYERFSAGVFTQDEVNGLEKSVTRMGRLDTLRAMIELIDDDTITGIVQSVIDEVMDTM